MLKINLDVGIVFIVPFLGSWRERDRENDPSYQMN